MQVILLATIALGLGSLCTIAVPKLAGDLIDICIHYGQGSFDADAAKHQLNGNALCLQACQHGKQSHNTGRTTAMVVCVIRRHALQNSDCIGSGWNGKWFPLMVSW